MGWRERVETRLARRRAAEAPKQHPRQGGRYWPTEKIRPGESVSDYCRRLDVYENLRHGSVSDG